MVVSSVFPVFALIALGALLRRRGLTDDAFLRTGDRLVYFAFFPLLLFWKVGGSASTEVPWRLWGAMATIHGGMWLLSLLAIAVFRIPARRAATFAQAVFRFNTYVAIAVVANAQGDAGVATLGEIVALIIPLVNVLAVVTFIWFARDGIEPRRRVRLTLRALVQNPLILACAAGMVYARLMPAWPLAVDNALRLASSLALPFALVSIGGALRFEGLGERLPVGALATAMKIVLMPAVGWFVLNGFGITGPDLLTSMLLLAMPASTAMYVLATQLDGDAQLSSSIIVLTTIASFASLTVVLLLLG